MIEPAAEVGTGAVVAEAEWSDGTIARAWFDETRTYRYKLERDFRARASLFPRSGRRAVTFVMLNPSTADATKNDPTITRCCNFAQAWGYGQLFVVNLFALRSTNPRALTSHADPVGAGENDAYIWDAALESDLAIAAWGVHGTYMDRDQQVMRLLTKTAADVRALGITKDGHPRHPLYVRGDTEPIPFGVRA